MRCRALPTAQPVDGMGAGRRPAAFIFSVKGNVGRDAFRT